MGSPHKSMASLLAVRVVLSFVALEDIFELLASEKDGAARPLSQPSPLT